MAPKAGEGATEYKETEDIMAGFWFGCKVWLSIMFIFLAIA
jgi:hypothetical protein